MRIIRNIYGWRPSLLSVLTLCALIGATYACSTTGKKEKAESMPGDERIVDLREQISKNIEDPDKRINMLELVDRFENDLAELDRVVVKLYTDLKNLNDDYNAPPGAFQKLFTNFESDHNQIRDRIVGSRFKLKDLSTPEEWKKLTDHSEREGLYQQVVRQPDQ